MSGQGSLWLRWSWRDLRRHWGAVLTIGVVIAIGTGVFAGLGSTAEWRRLSNDASFAELRLHDLRVELSPGTFAPEGSLRDLALGLPSAGDIVTVDERLVLDTQIDASTSDETILVAARFVGNDYARAGVVDDVWVSEGRLDPDSVVLEKKFADFYRLDTTGQLEIAGGAEVAYTGLGVAPEDFYVTGEQGSVFAHADLAMMYAPVATVQELSGHRGEVNDLVLSITGDADRGRIESELETALAAVGSISAAVSDQDDVEAFRVLYDDIENDQQMWNALSALVVGAAALAAFNLITRIVESQRREIGIGMALGVPRARLAVRPILTGLQVGVIGTVAGIGVGILIGTLMQGLMRSVVPMPQWLMPFQYGVFLRAALLGMIPPIIAAVLPVRRALRVEPVEAIRTGHLAAGSGRRGAWIRRVRVPGRSVAQMPVRNLLRAPRRTVLTALGVGAAITALVAVLGMLDSFDRAIARGTDELTKGDPDRITVVLDTFYPTDSSVLTDIAAADAVGDHQPTLRIPGVVSSGDIEIDLSVELLDLDGGLWFPTLTNELDTGTDTGLVLAEKAAADLGVNVGDTVVLVHPEQADAGFVMARTDLVVSATHPNPIRNFAFLDAAVFADDLGFGGWANGVQVVPNDGSTRGDVQRTVFTIDGVASAQPVARIGDAFDEALTRFVGFLIVTAGAVLLLAVLIAFNSARISVEERRRQNATMLAFGVHVRRVVGVIMREALAIGILATLIGTIAGIVVLGWMLDSLAARTLPDIQINPVLSGTSVAIAAAVGIFAVLLAPLLLVRRIRRMNLPDTLRVME